MKTYQAIKVTERVYWVGAFDWDIRSFHGYSTSRGTTYNAFLILGSEPILIDTVKAPFYDEMVARIRSVVDPKKIKHVISNHAEMDHSGCLPKVLNLIQPDNFFASIMGCKALQAHFGDAIQPTAVKNGEVMQLGDAKLTFLETRMLHWPDSMFTYLHEDGLLFSQDGFGMHLSTSQLFADQNPRDILEYEAGKYYANILMLFSPQVNKLLASPTVADLDIKMIAPDHGPIWRTPEDIAWILDCYRRWNEQKPGKKVVIVYDTMWQSTAKMAQVIAEGVIAEGLPVKLLSAASCDRSDVATELLEAGALVAGSPTINKQMFPTMADILCYLKGLNRRNLVGQAFGSFGWGGEGAVHVQNDLKEMGVELVGELLKVNYVPTDADFEKCFELGKQIAQAVKRGQE